MTFYLIICFILAFCTLYFLIMDDSDGVISCVIITVVWFIAGLVFLPELFML